MMKELLPIIEPFNITTTYMNKTLTQMSPKVKKFTKF